MFLILKVTNSDHPLTQHNPEAIRIQDRDKIGMANLPLHIPDKTITMKAMGNKFRK